MSLHQTVPHPATVTNESRPGAKDLFSSLRLGELELPNRMVMAPMTRSRALGGNVPNPIAATYYAQRASAGLIVTEATQVSPQGVGYIRTPGIHSAEQVAGWRTITDAVHRVGGTIFAQLWHVGRVSHPDFHDGALPVAPSALPVDGEAFTPQGKVKIVTPRALETNEIPGIVGQFRKGAENAKAAGFDGVEIHGANGYLLDQFLRDGSNHRTDAYGGSLPNRVRFPLEVAEAVAGVWGAERVGYRIAPYFAMYSMSDSNPIETFSYLTERLSELGLGYLHVLEAVGGPMATPASTVRALPILRQKFNGAVIVNGGYDLDTGNAVIARGEADLVAFGVPFLANPDLPVRFRRRAPLNKPDQATFYAAETGDEKGYIDYPAMAAQ
ncbi:MAG: N-ethylmaleimide reductase [Alphaproteobacteria bacterium]|jgi:N-ethylmaleimide reductase|nr:N-ethylmaleimide reductase [Alphaproteobacteria bacterium]